MGMLIKGELVDNWLEKEIDGGEFKRMESSFRNWVTVDGSAGPSGDGGFKAEADRYHLYVSAACPWAHRTVIFRKLKKTRVISLGCQSSSRTCSSRAGPLPVPMSVTSIWPQKYD